MNYGHDLGGPTYDTAGAEADLSFLKATGITRLRVNYPTYSNANLVANCQDLARRALNHGFYVIWGYATGAATPPNLTATLWASYKSYLTGTAIPTIVSSGVSEFSVGNECDFQVDNTTLTAATVQADVRSLAATVKTSGFPGKVSYTTAAVPALRSAWASGGLGSLDLIGWNNYGQVSNFTTFCSAIISNFGAAATYISEFGSQGGGFPDFNNDENLFASDTLNRISAMQSAGLLSAHFYTYKDDSTGPSANTFGLVQSNGVAHCVRGAILNTPGQPAYGMYGH